MPDSYWYHKSETELREYYPRELQEVHRSHRGWMGKAVTVTRWQPVWVESEYDPDYGKIYTITWFGFVIELNKLVNEKDLKRII